MVHTTQQQCILPNNGVYDPTTVCMTQRWRRQPNDGVYDTMTVWTTQQQCRWPNNSADDPTMVQTTQQRCRRPNNSAYDPMTVQTNQRLLPEPSKLCPCLLTPTLINTALVCWCPCRVDAHVIDAHTHWRPCSLTPMLVESSARWKSLLISVACSCTPAFLPSHTPQYLVTYYRVLVNN